MTILVDGELVLYGFVGDSYWEQGFTAREVIDALAELGRDSDVVVRINSGGGYVDDGIAIYNALAQHKGKVTVIVDAVAASSASIIAMGGKERIMRKGAMMMIHDPASVVWGTAEDMAKAVTMLEKHAANLAGIYADVTGEDADDIRADMKTELWLSADEAVERGFATSANDTKAKAAAAHDYSVYAQAPERLVALTRRKNWSHAETGNRPLASAKATTPPTKENRPMTTEPTADSSDAGSADAAKLISAEKDRVKAILNSDEAKGRDELARHFALETDMTADAAIAAMKVSPKAAAQPGKPQSYADRRMAAASLAQPAAEAHGAETASTSVLSAAVARFNKRR